MKRLNFACVIACFIAVALLLLGCGTNNGSAGNGGSGGTNYTGQAQGVYSGTASSGYSFSSIVLPGALSWEE